MTRSSSSRARSGRKDEIARVLAEVEQCAGPPSDPAQRAFEETLACPQSLALHSALADALDRQHPSVLVAADSLPIPATPGSLPPLI